MAFTLRTPRLLLRDYRVEDWQRAHLYASDPEVSLYDEWGPNTPEQTQAFVNAMVIQSVASDRYKFELAIELEGLMIGGCGIRRESQLSSIASLGWVIHPDFQNQGFCTEAAWALLQFGFERLGLAVIYATCDARNAASFRVMEKLKMNKVGRIEGDKIQKGHLRTTLRYELRKSLT